MIAPFYVDIDWDDLETIEHHETDPAYHRTKTMDAWRGGGALEHGRARRFWLLGPSAACCQSTRSWRRRSA